MSLEPTRAGGSVRQRTDSDSARIRFRRAVGLVVMTLFLPGSAQLVAGNRRIGRIAVWTSLTLFAIAAVLGLLTWSNRGIGLSLLTNTELLYVLRGLLVGFAIAWAALFVNA